MGWRTLYVEHPGKLSLVRNRVKYFCENPEEEFEIPLEDLNAIIISSNRMSITTRLLSAFSESGTAAYFCNKNHLPSGVLIPYSRHHRSLAVIQKQLSITQPLQKRIWQKIVQAKIMNQSRVLKHISENDFNLSLLAKKVKSGDSSNVEASAAKKYWKYLFDNFRRNDDKDPRNTALNYGYSILRGILARSIAVSGLIPSLGVHHQNMLNPFNLADDLLEPLRPFVDAEVKAMEENISELPKQKGLNRTSRLKLIDILHHDCQIADIRASVTGVCKQLPLSYIQAIEKKDIDALQLPVWV